MNRSGGERRGQSEAIGTFLMVALTITAVGMVGVVALDFLAVLGGPTASTVVDLQETDAGMQLDVEYAGQAAAVKINGESVTTIEGDDAGRSLYLPTAPGDRVTVVATADDRSVLLSETVDQGQAGDFVGYYTFEAGSGSTLLDRSMNDNNGTIDGATWKDTAEGKSLQFDGDDFARVDNITTGNISDVEAFTVVVKFNITEETGDNQQLVEHHTDSGNEWFLETPDSDAPFALEFAVNYPDDTITTRNESIGLDETHVAVATYDGKEYKLYIDGTLVSEENLSREVEMGQITIGRDDEQSIQYLAGHIYEFRMYYTAFDASEVKTITETVD